jgi:multidrug efflux pump
VVLLLGGIMSYSKLGQDEDPPFTFRAMVIRAYWPGSSSVQMAEQVTDKLEKKLQETPFVDKIRSYSKPGETLIILELRESTPPKEVTAGLVSGTQKNWRYTQQLTRGCDGSAVQ